MTQNLLLFTQVYFYIVEICCTMKATYSLESQMFSWATDTQSVYVHNTYIISGLGSLSMYAASNFQQAIES